MGIIILGEWISPFGLPSKVIDFYNHSFTMDKAGNEAIRPVKETIIRYIQNSERILYFGIIPNGGSVSQGC